MADQTINIYFESYPDSNVILKVKNSYFLEHQVIAAKSYASIEKAEIEVFHRKDLDKVAATTDNTISLDTKLSSKKLKK
jgi:hypothetical protein